MTMNTVGECLVMKGKAAQIVGVIIGILIALAGLYFMFDGFH